MFKKENPIRWAKFSLPLLVSVTILILWGCKNYDDPAKTAVTNTGSVLIDAVTLKSWVDKDLVNSDEKFEKVVILDVTSASEYAKGHIPGAQLLDKDNELNQDRIEGPSKGKNMVLEGAKIDEVLRNHGINERTTIVITSSQTNVYIPGRAYFLFRYWGFSKERLKFLNGLNGAWTTAGYSMESTVPGVTPSTYSVKNLGAFNPDQRASLDEMITAVRAGSGIPWDTRANGTVDVPITTGFIDGSKYVVFEGTIKGGKYYMSTNLTNSDLTFKDTATIQAALIAAGIDGIGGKVIYPFCRSGVIAGAGYFVLDAILGWKAMLYDGSWYQWGQMSSDTANGGKLPSGSPWITDDTNLMEYSYYNVGKTPSGSTTALTTANIETLVLEGFEGFGSENQIEKDDTLYMQSGGGSSSSTGTAASGGYGQ
jgi:3-mercaptopyruvate sulfurtransferase SseA